MQTSKNYVGYDMVLTDDVQIVRGVAGNALYFPFGHGHIQHDNNYNDVSFSLWRRWDGVDDNDYRGILETANVKIYFDNKTDKLKIELAGLEPVTLDVLDETGDEFINWVFIFEKGGNFRAYKNEELVCIMPIGNFVVNLKSEGLTIGGGKTHASFDEIRTDKAIYTDAEIRGLHRLISRGVQASDVQEMVSESAPKYLGTVKTVQATRTAVITKGERLGAVRANTGDWVLMTEEIGGWKQGVCYKWTGTRWIALQPEVNYVQEYNACVFDLFSIENIANQTGKYGAMLCKKLVAQDALITSLTASVAFLEKLVVKNVLVDNDTDDPNDFSVEINKDVGIKAMNEGKKVFEVDTQGDIFAQNAVFQDCFLKNGLFTGEIKTSVFDLIKKDENIGLLFSYSKNTKTSVIYNSRKPGSYATEGLFGTKKLISVKVSSMDKKLIKEELEPVGSSSYYKISYSITFKLKNEEKKYSYGHFEHWAWTPNNGSFKLKDYDSWDEIIPFQIKAYEPDIADMVVKFKKLSKGVPTVPGVVYAKQENGTIYLCIS